jgi:hypothetical protein
MIEEKKQLTTSKYIRKTHCFNCKEDINSQQNDTCESCKGIVCGCGSCFCEWEEPSFLYQ